MNGEPVMVMLVEDNMDHAELVMRTLEDHRIANRIRHFTDGQTALDYLLCQGEFLDPAASPRPHVILLDLRLPRVDGLQVLEVIKGMRNLKPSPLSSSPHRRRRKTWHGLTTTTPTVILSNLWDTSEFKKLMDDLGVYWLGWNTHPHI